MSSLKPGARSRELTSSTRMPASGRGDCLPTELIGVDSKWTRWKARGRTSEAGSAQSSKSQSSRRARFRLDLHLITRSLCFTSVLSRRINVDPSARCRRSQHLSQPSASASALSLEPLRRAPAGYQAQGELSSRSITTERPLLLLRGGCSPAQAAEELCAQTQTGGALTLLCTSTDRPLQHCTKSTVPRDPRHPRRCSCRAHPEQIPSA
jgi:hypothetical protein